MQAAPIGVLFIDIDHFKRINDTYGHGVGDDVLREFAMVLSEVVDSKNKVVRWGGEEFVVFCQHMSHRELVKLAEHVRHYVHAHLWVHGDEMSCSIGVALGGNQQIYDTINFADDMLYEAKQKGRNCVRAIDISS
jgi:diguanylate cyclase (GGDEF)-like protein